MNNRDDLIYLAPMEGITGYIYRNAHHKYFGGVDKYFMPFIAPAKGRPLRNRELRDVLPENNQGINVVPTLRAVRLPSWSTCTTFGLLDLMRGALPLDIL